MSGRHFPSSTELTETHHALVTMMRLAVVTAVVAAASARMNEVWDRNTTEAHGIVWRGNYTTS